MSKRTKRDYSKTPSVGIAITPERAQALSLLAAQRSMGGAKVYVADLVAQAVESMWGPEITAALSAAPCPICHIAGGCEHTFKRELPIAE